MQLYLYNGQITTYMITTEGKLFNKKTNKWLKGAVSKNGYHTYYISMDGLKKRLYTHRMVAETFLSKESHQNQVNHKDGNKLNNSVENLEWVTAKENTHHAIDNKLINTKIPVYFFSKEKKRLGMYESIADAIRQGYSLYGLHRAIHSEIAFPYKGLYWRLSPEENFPSKEAIRSGKAKIVGKFLASGELIEKYDSINEAARNNHCNKNRISDCCNKRIKSYQGFIWKFLSKI